MQVPLGTVPDVVERDLLQEKNTQHTQLAAERRSQKCVSETPLNSTACLEYTEIINYTDMRCHR